MEKKRSGRSNANLVNKSSLSPANREASGRVSIQHYSPTAEKRMMARAASMSPTHNSSPNHSLPREEIERRLEEVKRGMFATQERIKNKSPEARLAMEKTLEQRERDASYRRGNSNSLTEHVLEGRHHSVNHHSFSDTSVVDGSKCGGDTSHEISDKDTTVHQSLLGSAKRAVSANSISPFRLKSPGASSNMKIDKDKDLADKFDFANEVSTPGPGYDDDVTAYAHLNSSNDDLAHSENFRQNLTDRFYEEDNSNDNAERNQSKDSVQSISKILDAIPPGNQLLTPIAESVDGELAALSTHGKALNNAAFLMQPNNCQKLKSFRCQLYTTQQPRFSIESEKISNGKRCDGIESIADAEQASFARKDSSDAGRKYTDTDHIKQNNVDFLRNKKKIEFLRTNSRKYSESIKDKSRSRSRSNSVNRQRKKQLDINESNPTPKLFGVAEESIICNNCSRPAEERSIFGTSASNTDQTSKNSKATEISKNSGNASSTNVAHPSSVIASMKKSRIKLPPAHKIDIGPALRKRVGSGTIAEGVPLGGHSHHKKIRNFDFQTISEIDGRSLKSGRVIHSPAKSCSPLKGGHSPTKTSISPLHNQPIDAFSKPGSNNDTYSEHESNNTKLFHNVFQNFQNNSAFQINVHVNNITIQNNNSSSTPDDLTFVNKTRARMKTLAAAEKSGKVGKKPHKQQMDNTKNTIENTEIDMNGKKTHSKKRPRDTDEEKLSTVGKKLKNK